MLTIMSQHSRTQMKRYKGAESSLWFTRWNTKTCNVSKQDPSFVHFVVITSPSPLSFCHSQDLKETFTHFSFTCSDTTHSFKHWDHLGLWQRLCATSCPDILPYADWASSCSGYRTSSLRAPLSLRVHSTVPHFCPLNNTHFSGQFSPTMPAQARPLQRAILPGVCWSRTSPVRKLRPWHCLRKHSTGISSLLPHAADGAFSQGSHLLPFPHKPPMVCSVTRAWIQANLFTKESSTSSFGSQPRDYHNQLDQREMPPAKSRAPPRGTQLSAVLPQKPGSPAALRYTRKRHLV